jgi:hypothetical protein
MTFCLWELEEMLKIGRVLDCSFILDSDTGRPVLVS